MSAEEVQAKLDAVNLMSFVKRLKMWVKHIFDDEVYGRIEVDGDVLDEQILIKSDGYPTYNFANIIDDHQMQISHVVRGNEYLSSTPKYNLIYDAYGWERPTYVHVPPVMKDEHHKLSKRNGGCFFPRFSCERIFARCDYELYRFYLVGLLKLNRKSILWMN